MQKLTKQQSEWLIEQIKHTLQNPTFGLRVCDYELIESIVNQCTEKEFPRLLMNAHEKHRLVCIRETECMTTGLKNISLIDEVIGSYGANVLNLTYDEFKQFTQGCVEICKWLEEQE